MSNIKTSRLYKDLDLDFTVVGTGDVGKKNGINAVKQSLKSLLLTNYYERPFDPKKGANLTSFLFEPLSSNVAKIIEKTVLNMISNYEQRVRVSNLTITPNFDDNAYVLKLEYYIVGIAAPQIFSADLKRLR